MAYPEPLDSPVVEGTEVPPGHAFPEKERVKSNLLAENRVI
jgi:hypothetical protein